MKYLNPTEYMQDPHAENTSEIHKILYFLILYKRHNQINFFLHVVSIRLIHIEICIPFPLLYILSWFTNIPLFIYSFLCWTFTLFLRCCYCNSDVVNVLYVSCICHSGSGGVSSGYVNRNDVAGSSGCTFSQSQQRLSNSL